MQAAHAHVREQYVADVHLQRYAKLLGNLIGGSDRTGQVTTRARKL